MTELLKQLMGFLGKEGTGDLLKTGVSLYSANQAGNQNDFNNAIATDNQKKNNILFDQQQSDRAATQLIDF